MNPILVGSVFGAAFILALMALYVSHARWYWHVLSVLAAFTLGFTPFPDGFRPPDLLTGAVFIFMLVWGAGEIAVHPYHRTRRKAHHA